MKFQAPPFQVRDGRDVPVAQDARKPYGSIETGKAAAPPSGVRSVRKWLLVAGILALLAGTFLRIATILSRASASSAVPDARPPDDGDSAAAAVSTADTMVAYFTEQCGALGDTVFTPELCGPPDATAFCPYLCAPGSGCFEICGDACGDADSSWGAYCLLSALADLESVCAGTFVAAPPPLPPADAVVAEPTDPMEVAVLAMTCGTHAVCTACDDMRNANCRAIFLSATAFSTDPALAPSLAKTVDDWEAASVELGLPPLPEVRVQREVWVALPAFLEPGALDATCALRGYDRPLPTALPPHWT